MESFRIWMKSGAPWVWLNAAAVSACIALVGGLLLLAYGLLATFLYLGKLFPPLTLLFRGEGGAYFRLSGSTATPGAH